MTVIKRASLIFGVLVAVALSPTAAALAQPHQPQHPRDKACERSQGRPPFCDQYPPPPQNVACDRSKAPPGRPPFCRARGFAPHSAVQVVLRGPLGPSDAKPPQPPARTFTTRSDDAGMAGFQAPLDLALGSYELVFVTAETVLPPVTFELVSGSVGEESAETAPESAQADSASDSTGFELTNGMVVALVGIALVGVMATRRRSRSGPPAK